MSENNALESLFRAIGHSINADVEKKKQDKKANITEKIDAFKDNPIGKAKESVGLALWEGIRKVVPFVVLSAWIVAFVVLLVVVASFLVLGIAYIFHLLGWVTLSRVGEVKLFLANVFTFPSGVASAALLFFLNRKPQQ